jgi:hypothetical protein
LRSINALINLSPSVSSSRYLDQAAACIAAIKAEGLPVPIKSACFMCPNCKKPEITALGQERSDLAAKAIELETRGT